ncbi:hypothetical protein HYT59_01055 [Candidatus Woesebacteria bacterium]|nr:hypothetical protein [Candidatus Woesebacteria bacterium]
MNLEEEIKKLKEQVPDNPIPLSKMTTILAATLDQAATNWAFKTYWDKRFLKLAQIDELEQTEKDRIFNELILASLCLVILTLEARDLRQEEAFKDYLLKVKDEITNVHTDQLKELGIERKHWRLWQKLIKMRYEEYEESRLTAREAMMEYEGKEKNLEIADLTGINLTIPPFIVAVGAHKHIARGRIKGRDLLFKLIMKKLSRFYTEVRIIIEGGKISPTLRALMRLKHFWNDLIGKITFDRG